MTDAKQNTHSGRKPDWRLVQEKAYYKTGLKGHSSRASKTIEIAVGWNEVGLESGKPYISWSDSVTPVLPDVDGRIALRAFEISYEGKK